MGEHIFCRSINDNASICRKYGILLAVCFGFQCILRAFYNLEGKQHDNDSKKEQCGNTGEYVQSAFEIVNLIVGAGATYHLFGNRLLHSHNNKKQRWS